MKEKCPVCGNEFDPEEMWLTSDYHGIPYRKVCSDCYSKVMEEGYDGQPYEYDYYY